MTLYTQSQSVVAFGVEKLGDYLIAELVVYMEGLRNKVTCFDKKTGDKYTLFVPNEIKGSMLPGMALDVTFVQN
jgi:hypothetical protein